MTACVYPTVLNKPCGRAAVRRVRWEEHNGLDQETHDWPLCPFHRDLKLADLLLSCAVHVITVLTLDGEVVLPKEQPQPGAERDADHWAQNCRRTLTVRRRLSPSCSWTSGWPSGPITRD